MIDVKDVKDKMEASIEALKRELVKIRTGRASLALLEGIKVNAYGSTMPIEQVGTMTIPFLMNMAPTMSNAARFTQQQEGTPKYAYTLCLSESFLDKLVAYKAAYIGTEAGKAAMTEYYSTGMYPTLDGYCAAYGAPTSLELALNAQNAAGLKAQTTYIPE